MFHSLKIDSYYEIKKPWHYKDRIFKNFAWSHTPFHCIWSFCFPCKCFWIQHPFIMTFFHILLTPQPSKLVKLRNYSSITNPNDWYQEDIQGHPIYWQLKLDSHKLIYQLIFWDDSWVWVLLIRIIYIIFETLLTTFEKLKF